MNLKRGINLGGYLSQCEHTYPHYDSFISEKDIEAIKDMGFDHVRVPVDCNVFEEEDGTWHIRGNEYIESVIVWTKKHGLDMVLDLHKAYGYRFQDAGDKEKNNLFLDEQLKDRFVGLWKKVAEHYGKYEHVAFELLNEVVEKENADAWNELIARSVDEIRKVSPEKTIIYGGIQWNSVKTLKLLEKPKDENIIFTFHFYEPLIFTHQKAYWVDTIDPNETIYYPKSMDYYCKASEKLGYQGEVVGKASSSEMGEEFIEEMVMEAIDAAKKAGVTLYCGEFGVIDQAPVEDTYRWFVDVNKVFKKHGIGYCLWTYKAMDFGLIDEHYAPIKDRLIKLWNEND